VFLAVILLLPRGVIPTISEKISLGRSRRAGRPVTTTTLPETQAVPQPAAGRGKEAGR
jgi:hypothetical protein